MLGKAKLATEPSWIHHLVLASVKLVLQKKHLGWATLGKDRILKWNCLGTPGAAGMGLDINDTLRGVDSVESAPIGDSFYTARDH